MAKMIVSKTRSLFILASSRMNEPKLIRLINNNNKYNNKKYIYVYKTKVHIARLNKYY